MPKWNKGLKLYLRGLAEITKKVKEGVKSGYNNATTCSIKSGLNVAHDPSAVKAIGEYPIVMDYMSPFEYSYGGVNAGNIRRFGEIALEENAKQPYRLSGDDAYFYINDSEKDIRQNFNKARGIAESRKFGNRYANFLLGRINKTYDQLSKDPVWNSILTESPQYLFDIRKFEDQQVLKQLDDVTKSIAKQDFVKQLIQNSNSYMRVMHPQYINGEYRHPTINEALHFQGANISENRQGNSTIDVLNYFYPFAKPNSKIYYFQGHPQITGPIETWWSQRIPAGVTTRSGMWSESPFQLKLHKERFPYYSALDAQRSYNEVMNESRWGRDPTKDTGHQVFSGVTGEILPNFTVTLDWPEGFVLGRGYKKGGKLVPKGQEGFGKWFLKLLAKESPSTTKLLGYTEKAVQGSKKAEQLQKGVQRAQKISKFQQFKELVSGLELEDRVSSELISRYKALDPDKQKAERDIVVNLMKNGQIHSITDFDLAIDKIGKGKQAKDPNLYKYKTLTAFDSEHTLGYFQKLEEKKAAKEKYDQAFGSFEKLQDFPELGLSLHKVPETEQGRLDLRFVMGMQNPKQPQPWCVLKANGQSLWDEIYGGPKFVLIDEQGKIKHFKSGQETFYNLQDQPSNFRKQLGNNGIISYSMDSRRLPFDLRIRSKEKKLPTGTYAEIIYSRDGSRYIRLERLNPLDAHQKRSVTDISFDKNGNITNRSEETTETGPLHVQSRGQWRTTASGNRVFDTYGFHSSDNQIATYNDRDELLQISQPGTGYSTIFEPFDDGLVLTTSPSGFAIHGPEYRIGADKFNDYLLPQQQIRLRNMYQPLAYQRNLDNGKILMGTYDPEAPEFGNILDALKYYNFKFPIYKKGGILKGKIGTVPGWAKEIYEVIARNSRKTSKKIEELSKGFGQQVQQSSLGQVVKGAVTHPVTVAKSIPLYLHDVDCSKGLAHVTDQRDFIADNFDFLQNFYKNLYNLRHGYSVGDKIGEQLKNDNIAGNILQFNLNNRDMFAKQHGYNMDLKHITDKVNKIPITFHFFPFKDTGAKIPENTWGYFDPLYKSAHINVNATEKAGNTASVVMHEWGAHGLQDAVKQEIHDLDWQATGYDSNGNWVTPKDLGNFKNTEYFTEEQSLLDYAYPIESRGMDANAVHDLYARRDKPYTSGDFSSPIEQSATNNEIKYLYANKYGIDFSRLKKHEDLPDLIRIDNVGKMVEEPFTGIGSSYAVKYRDNMQSLIDAYYDNWIQTNPGATSEEARNFLNSIEKSWNDRLKKAVFYVGGLSGASYLGSNLNNQEQ